MMMIIFYSCSTEDESINKSGKTKTITKSEKNKTIEKTETALNISVQEKLNLFSEQIFVSCESFEIALNKNTDVDFNAQVMHMIETAEDEYDLKIAFEMAGIANSKEVINILKHNITIKQEFIVENPNFYNLTLEKRVELLNTSIDLVENNYFPTVPLPLSELVGGPDCAGGFRKSRGRCQRDFTICTAGALVTAYVPPFWPGLVVEAICAVQKLYCDNDAVQDYQDCAIDKQFGQLPVTGELTIHCDKYADSCWTTDSNGKYVGRYLGK